MVMVKMVENILLPLKKNTEEAAPKLQNIFKDSTHHTKMNTIKVFLHGHACQCQYLPEQLVNNEYNPYLVKRTLWY